MWTLIIVSLAIVAITAVLIHRRNRAADRRWQARMSALQNDQEGTRPFSWDKPLEGRPEYIRPVVKKDRTSRRDSSNTSSSTYHDTSLFSGIIEAPADDPPQAPAFHGGGGSFGGGGATVDLGDPTPSAGGFGGGDFGGDVGGDGD